MTHGDSVPLYPLVLDPIYKDKVWGGRTLETLGRTLPGGDTNLIGESWELADMAAASPSGEGGAAAYSKILNGPLNKRALGEVVKEFGPIVTGAARLNPDGSFPLLLKYLDATENLSVQVHPSVEFASDHPDARLKSEAWYIVAAEPGAVIYKGVKAGTTRDVFAAAIEDGTVEKLMIRVPAVAGDCHYLPSGTCHALGGGILVAEVQTPSDTTFRVFDWGRAGRELHVEDALACIDYGPAETSGFEPGTVSERDDATGRDLVICEHFSIREWLIPNGGQLTLESDAVAVLMLLSGEAEVRWGEAGAQALKARAGNTIVLPAALAAVTLEASHDATVLEITIPSEETAA
jgi:mannose-6-phosphate isomerase